MKLAFNKINILRDLGILLIREIIKRDRIIISNFLTHRNSRTHSHLMNRWYITFTCNWTIYL